ncbi:hypothetical protein [Paenibacillus kribbensis]|uniref:hypothetical protein n=1 Tax=Paenibacillus kribbensis TaxID=172713 RepID=UPI000AFF35F2|nr:hypothetical protein [Paenibacillus kribbensis]
MTTTTNTDNRRFEFFDYFYLKINILYRMDKHITIFSKGDDDMKKLLLAASMVLLLSLSAGVVNASAASSSTPAPQKEVFAKYPIYTITLKVGQTYQLPYAYGYKYYNLGGEGYFSIGIGGEVTALKAPLTERDSLVGSVGILDKNLNEVAEVYIMIMPQ